MEPYYNQPPTSYHPHTLITPQQKTSSSYNKPPDQNAIPLVLPKTLDGPNIYQEHTTSDHHPLLASMPKDLTSNDSTSRRALYRYFLVTGPPLLMLAYFLFTK